MYNQVRTDTRNSLARRAIKAVFYKDFYKEQEDMVSFYQQYLSNRGLSNTSQVFRFSWLKQSRRMITYKLTDTLMQTLPVDWQKMARLYYAEDKPQVKISGDLFISSSTLNNWDIRLLEMVVNYAILLRISKDDVFYLPRLINMVKALSDISMLIKRLEQYGKLDIVSPGFIANVNQRMVNYRAIINIMDNHRLNHDQGLLEMVVTAKCNSPMSTAFEIAKVCGGIHPTVVGKYLKDFYREIDYLLV